MFLQFWKNHMGKVRFGYEIENNFGKGKFWLNLDYLQL